MFFFKSVIISASNREQVVSKIMSSRNINATRNTAATAVAPYCKVCYDAGKPKSEYTSHFVKDQPGPQGKVICPTLLNQACRICHKDGHTSSYCPQYKSRRDYREEPRREERYIPREEPRREERYIPREEPRREERYIPREEPRREERYIPREEPRRNSGYYDSLREDTERRERDIQQRDEEYNRQQDRRSKPWLQAALKTPEQQQQRREPYAHPHGPRTRLSLEANALCASKHAVAAAAEEPEVPPPATPAIDIQKVNLNHASKWGDEDAEEPFVYNPEEMSREFFQNAVMSSLTTNDEYDFMAACDNQNEMPFFCGQ
jgi:hypothetical protein